jgi:hypothetical protein
MMLNNSINVTNFAYLRIRLQKPNKFITSFGYFKFKVCDLITNFYIQPLVVNQIISGLTWSKPLAFPAA